MNAPAREQAMRKQGSNVGAPPFVATGCAGATIGEVAMVEAGVVESAVLTIPATLPGPLWVTLLDWKLGLGGKMCVDPYVLQPVLPSE